MRLRCTTILLLAPVAMWGADCFRTSTGLAPLNDPDFQTYQGMAGGLYPNRSNTRPPEHEAAGLKAAAQVRPRNAQGDIDEASGKIVLLSIGMSNTTQEFTVFQQLAGQDKDRNPKLVIVDGAQGGWSADRLVADPAPYWRTVEQRIAAAGVTAAQVQVAWMKQADRGPNLPFPEDARKLEAELKQIVQSLRPRFPNLRMLYLSSRIYGGYASTPLNPEPYAYQGGFAVKWLIERQIQGDRELSYEAGTAPWMSWGPYLWADGTRGRHDGLVWNCEDLRADDGTHPSPPGQRKVADLLLNFLKTDTTARRWFTANLAHVAWTAFAGSHYAVHPWAQSVRDHLQDRGEASLTTGRVDLVVVENQGLGSARNQEAVSAFMNQMQTDRGESFRKQVYERALHLAKTQPEGRRAYWQIGNELNGPSYSETLHGWAGDGATARFHDSFVIPYYAEYYLAPAAEAIRAASQEWSGSEDSIPIMLGSTANAFNQTARNWLYELLDYRIRGEFAPRLAGKTPAELVDLVSIHYLVSSDAAWSEGLEEIWSRCAGRGRIQGVWSTEELGRQRADRGLGAASALKVAARYLHWMGERAEPASAGRFFLWGSDIGTVATRGNTGMQMLFDSLGNTPLEEFPGAVRLAASGGFESYAFESVTDRRKRVVIVFPTTQQDSGVIDSLEVSAAWPPARLAATLHVFSSTGHETSQVIVSVAGDTARITFAPPVELRDQALALVLLNQEPQE